jgi:4-amino-4-deoxy-L-arabinose transferase-like glycosyltransferase
MTLGLAGPPADVEPPTERAPHAPAPAVTPGSRPRPGSTPGLTEISPARFWLSMSGVGVVAALVQSLCIHSVYRRTTLWPGARYVATQADNLVRGQWFVAPAGGLGGHVGTTVHGLIPTALHPPLPTVLIAIADVASISGATLHMVFLAVLFVVSVGLAGMTVRQLAGPRAGILAALIFATFPLLWVNPATLGPETVVIAVSSLLLFASVRFWKQPNVTSAAVVGFSLGLAALTRTDLIGLVVLLGLPLGLLVRHTTWLGRLRYLGVIAALFALVVSPWVIRNQVVIGHSAVFSDDYGLVLAGANCPATSTGPLEGWWSAPCAAAVPGTGTGAGAGAAAPAVASETTANRNGAHLARVYVSHHLSDSVGDAAVRFARLWNLYRPLQGGQLEQAVGRPTWVSNLGLGYFYVLVPVAAYGVVILRRRRALLFPLVAMLLLSSITAIVAYGDARFAVEADVALAMLGGVGLDALARLDRLALIDRINRMKRSRHHRYRHDRSRDDRSRDDVPAEVA